MRTIVLIIHASKILLRILLNRMEKNSKRADCKCADGLHKRSWTRDHRFNLRI